MTKAHILIMLGVLFVAGLGLILTDRWEIGLCLAVPAGLIAAVVAVLEPATEDRADTPAPGMPVSPAPRAQSEAAKPAKTTPVPPPSRGAGPERETVTGQGDKRTIDDLRRELEDLGSLANRKSREVEALTARLKERRDITILQRVAQFRHTIEFNRLMIAAGKMDNAGAVREMEHELESALDSLGIAVFPIDVGSKVRDLPNGSFELINGEPPSSPELAGTVKAVRQSAITYTDPEGKTHFLIPAKIDAYKLS